MRSIHLKYLFAHFRLIIFYLPAAGQGLRTEVAGIPVNYEETKVPA